MSAQPLFSDPASPAPPAPADEHKLLDRCANILWKTTGIFERFANEHRRHVSVRGPDPDYSTVPLIGEYHEGRLPSWQSWVMGIVAVLLGAGIPSLIWELSCINSNIAALTTRQTDAEKAQEERFKALEQRITRLESKVFQ